MVRRPQSPLDPPEAPDVRSLDESESNISPFIEGYDGETESQKQARERRNKLKQGRQHRARQRKEAWVRYESDLAEYNRRKSEQEVGERRAANTPYDRIREALEELRATTHPDERQEQLRNFFQPAIQKTHDGRTRSRPPAKSTSHEQEGQSKRKSAFTRLGPSGSHNRESKRDYSQNHRVEQPRKTISRAPAQTALQNYSHQDNSWQEGGAESEYQEAGMRDRFPCFASRLASIRLPHKFKPSNHSKYDGKTEPRQWLRIYSQSIELAGGDDNIKTLFFPMALETMPLQWFDKLNPGSIRNWEDLQRAFCENFAGIITHPITHAELKGLKQKGGESLRDYYRRFGELRAQVHDITEREVIEAFSHRIMAKWQF